MAWVLSARFRIWCPGFTIAPLGTGFFTFSHIKPKRIFGKHMSFMTVREGSKVCGLGSRAWDSGFWRRIPGSKQPQNPLSLDNPNNPKPYSPSTQQSWWPDRERGGGGGGLRECSAVTIPNSPFFYLPELHPKP